MGSLDDIFKALVLLLTLFEPFSCLDDCTGIDDIGMHFFVNDHSCHNYTAQFSWSLNILGDTLLFFSCMNETNGYWADSYGSISKSHGTLSFVVPLTGSVQCNLTGCYEDRNQFLTYRTPVYNIVCFPPPLPSTVVPKPSSSVQVSHQKESLSTNGGPSILPTVSPKSEQLVSNQTRSVEEFGIVTTSLSAGAGFIFVLCLLICLIEGLRRYNKRNREKCIVNTIPLDTTVDVHYRPTLTDYSNLITCVSSESLFDQTNIHIVIQTHTSDNDSTSTDQEISVPFPVHEEQAVPSAYPTPRHPQGLRAIEPDPLSVASAGIANGTSILYSAHHRQASTTEASSTGKAFSGSSYVHELNIQSGGEIKQHAISDIPQVSSLPKLTTIGDPRLITVSDSDEEIERFNRPWGIQYSLTERETAIETIQDESEVVSKHSTCERAGYKLEGIAPNTQGASQSIDDSVEGQNDEEDEVVIGFAERFVRRPASLMTHLPTPDTSSETTTTTSSGFSTSSYLQQWPTAEH